jgi:hypothetical protein
MRCRQDRGGHDQAEWPEGETISAWIDPHHLPHLRVFKFFADDTLHQELLLRRNGPLGADPYPIKSYHEYMTFLLSLVFHAPKPIKLGSKKSSTKLWGAVKHFKKSKNLKYSKKLKKLKKIKNIAKLSAIALEMAFSLKSYISNNFGQANKKFYRNFFHLNSKIWTSKSGLRIEFRRPGSEISPKNTFSSFLEGKLQNSRATLQNNDASSTLCLRQEIPHPNKQHWLYKVNRLSSCNVSGK